MVFSELCVGLIVVVGLPGNIYCVHQLRCPNLKRYTFTCYLMALALSDSGFLLALCLLSFYNVGIDFTNNHGICQLTYFLTYFCSFLSNWYIAALSFERFLPIYNSFKSYAPFVTSRSKVCLFTITLVGALLNSWTLITFESTEGIHFDTVTMQNESVVHCQFKESAKKYYQSINIFDLIISCAIPLTSILILNCVIARELFIVNKVTIFRLTEISGGLDRDRNSLSDEPLLRRRRNNEIKLGIFLLAISVTHLVLNLPSYIYRMVNSFTNPIEEELDVETEVHSTFDVIVHLVFYSQYSVNFLLYSLRKKLK